MQSTFQIENLYFMGVVAGIGLVSLLLIGIIFSKLYQRASKEVSFVRTGLGGEKVIKDGGAIVLPVLQDIIPVNMNTLKLEVHRSADQALITKDRMRVDVTVEFYLRVAPNSEAIATAAQTLGKRTLQVDALKALIEGKFVDVLRASAAEMSMQELHEMRSDFVQRVQNNVRIDLEKNGLELESVSLTAMDQTDPKFFRVDNAFDAEGLTQLTKITEERKKVRNDIERENETLIKQRNLEAEEQQLNIARQSEHARIQQHREIEVTRAAQNAEIEKDKAKQEQEAQLARISAERSVEEARIAKEQEIEALEIEKQKRLREAEIRSQSLLEIAEQDKAIALAAKSEQESAAKAEAKKAESSAVAAEEQVISVRETAVAERRKNIELIKAKEEAEKAAVSIQVAAEAEKSAALDKADALKTEAQAQADKINIAAEAQAKAEKITAQAKAETYRVEAEGKKALHEADNLLSQSQIEYQLKLALYKHLPEIVRESVKPMENIDGIKIVQMNGGLMAGSNGSHDSVQSSNNVADSVADAALRYRSQAPLVDALLKEVGIDGLGSQALSQLTQSVSTASGQAEISESATPLQNNNIANSKAVNSPANNGAAQ
ncbi:flotillin family protein [Catenovulum sediminis]|uniref:flotillin family protein n=1 Tax=Catenovulum sediminis TaxID=1740262 RepID=UPI00117EF14E|nr:flotillin domain-containing protein [Catenovulum sediminis]